MSAAIVQEKLSLIFRFHPLGNDVQVQAVCHRNDGAHDRSIAAVGGNVAHERLVNLELIQWQPLEVLQG